ncbi:hypothetical protein V1291_000939 [Nitrobacteraceae bacterium AZCC 1564]
MSDNRTTLLQTKARLLADLDRLNDILSKPCSDFVAEQTEAALEGTEMLLEAVERALGLELIAN